MRRPGARPVPRSPAPGGKSQIKVQRLLVRKVNKRLVSKRWGPFPSRTYACWRTRPRRWSLLRQAQTCPPALCSEQSLSAVWCPRVTRPRPLLRRHRWTTPARCPSLPPGSRLGRGTSSSSRTRTESSLR